MLINLGSTTAASVFAESPSPGVTGKLGVANGGTGLTAAPALLVNLEETSTANIFTAAPRPGVTGKLPIVNGGTGANTAAGARTNLGLGSIATKAETDYLPVNYTNLDFSSATTTAGVYPLKGVAHPVTNTTEYGATIQFGASSTSHNSYAAQLLISSISGATNPAHAYIRRMTSTPAWSIWSTLLDDRNYTDYAATKDHTHTMVLAEDTGTNQITLASGKKYKLTAGGSTFIFTMPTSNNYSLPVATSDALGGIKIGYAQSGKNYPVELANEKAYVNVPWTDTNTKVTSVENHYAPTADTNAKLTASLSGNAGTYALNTEYTVLTGIEIQRDAKGHVTGITYTAQKIKDTNTTYTLSGLGGIGTVNATGTAPLTLSASKSDTTVSITGSVAAATTSALGVVKVGTGLNVSSGTISVATAAGNSALSWNTEVTLATIGGLAIKAKLPANPNTNTDTLVKQTAKTDNVEYKLLATTSASPTSGNAAEAIYDTNVSINPNTHTLTASTYQVTADAKITYNSTTGCLEIIV